jgi:hypothetical protein
MFADKLYIYVVEEELRRRRDDRISLSVSLFLSAVMLALGSTTRAAAIGGLALLAASIAFSAIYYCVFYRKPVRTSRRQVQRQTGILYRPVSRRAALVSMSGAAAVVAVPLIGESILDRRLRVLAASAPLDQNSIQRIAYVINDATRYKLKLSRETLGNVTGALERTGETDSELAHLAVDVGGKTAAQSTLNIQAPIDMQGKAFGALPEAVGSKYAFLPIATNTGPDNYRTIGLAASPNIALMWNLVSSPPEGSYGPAYLVVEGLKATLDGFLLKHVIFQNMVLAYHGGPLVLEEVYFINCQFQFDPKPESWSLISTVIKGGWISFSNANEQG